MDHVTSTFGVFRKLCFFALLGGLTVLLLAPLLAIVAALFSVVLAVLVPILAFALIGFLVWVPYQVLTRDRHIALDNIRNTAKLFFQSLVVVPVGFCVRVGRGAAHVGKGALEKGRGLTAFIAGIALETVCGALVGGLVGAVGGVIHHEAEWRIPMGFLLGAVLGAVVGATRTKPAKDRGEKLFPLLAARGLAGQPAKPQAAGKY